MEDNIRMEELLDDPVVKELYGLFLKVKDSPRHISIKAETLLNEVNYIFTEFCHDSKPAEHLDRFENEIEVDLGWHYAICLVMPMTYAMMRLKEVKSKKLRTLMATMEQKYYSSIYWRVFAKDRSSVDKRRSRSRSIDTLNIGNGMPIIVKANKVVMMNPTIQGPVNSITKNKNVKL